MGEIIDLDKERARRKSDIQRPDVNIDRTTYVWWHSPQAPPRLLSTEEFNKILNEMFFSI